MAAPAEFDVVVVGGGSAGVAAGVAAAHLGARTLIVEREARLGGNAAIAFVHTICGLYRAADAGRAVALHPGLPQRIARDLIACGAAAPPERSGRVFVLPLEPPRYAAYLGTLCERSAGLEVRLQRTLEALELPVSGRAVATLRDAAGRVDRLTASIVVDASGDAAAAAAGAAPTLESAADELQLPSYIFRLAGVDRSGLAGFAKLRVTHALAGAARRGALPAACESVLLRPAGAADEVYVTLNVPRPNAYAPLDPAQIAALTRAARERAEQITGFLRETRPEFRRAEIVAHPDRVGIRETRRVAGRIEISREDVIEGRAHVDEVARSSWPIELWQDHRRARFEYPAAECSIPLGALVSRTRSRLAMAGRCLSASHAALGALRVIGTALATGEAAGVAAALAADRGVGLDAVAAAEVRNQILEIAAESEPAASHRIGHARRDGHRQQPERGDIG